VTREEVLAEIRRRAHREHGTAVRALLTILDEEIDGIRRRIPARTGAGAYTADYAEGMHNAVDLVEEALFRVFELWPDDQPTGGGAHGHG
jgi:hypothetical protein